MTEARLLQFSKFKMPLFHILAHMTRKSFLPKNSQNIHDCKYLK